MRQETISVTIDAAVLASADSDATVEGLNRSEMIEQAMRNEHLRIALRNYKALTVPALDIDAYAQQVYQLPSCEEPRSFTAGEESHPVC